MPVVIKNKNRYNINLQGIKPEWMSADIRFMTSGRTVKCEGGENCISGAAEKCRSGGDHYVKH